MTQQQHRFAAPLARTCVTGLRVTPEERIKVSATAFKAGIPLSVLIRDRSLRGQLRVIQSPVIASVTTILELKRITTNLDQIITELARRDIRVSAILTDTAAFMRDFVVDQIVNDKSDLTTSSLQLLENEPLRTMSLKVRYSPAERRQVEGLAIRTNLILSQYLRVQALDGIVVVIEPVADFSRQGFNRLQELGQVLNARAHRLNAGGDIPSDLEHLTQFIHRIIEEEIRHAARRCQNR